MNSFLVTSLCLVLALLFIVGSGEGKSSAVSHVDLKSVPGLAVRQGDVLAHAGWQFWELTPDLARAEITVVRRPSGGALLSSLVPPGALAVFNGGFFNPNFKPTSWVKSKGQVIKKKGEGRRGGVIAVDGTKVFIGPQAKLAFDPAFVIHNSPLLLDVGSKVGLRSDDGKRASRTVACLEKQSAGAAILHFVIILAEPQQGPTLMETANLLKLERSKGGFGCDSALNLDGGPSSGVWVAPGLNLPSESPLVPIGYGIAVSPS